MKRRMLLGLALAGSVLVASCSAESSNSPATGAAVTEGTVVGSVDQGGDPNEAGRSAAAATADSAAPPVPPALPGGSQASCVNQTLGESMTRVIDAGSSVVLATGGFTGTTATGDGEIGVPYSEVQLTIDRTLGGPALPQTLSAWVYGDLSATGGTANTGEASSLWARGGRMVAVVDTAEGSGLPGPVIRVAPVVGDEVILSWVGCWTTSGVSSREFDGAVDIFDERGLHPTELQLFAVSLDEFAGLLAV